MDERAGTWTDTWTDGPIKWNIYFAFTWLRTTLVRVQMVWNVLRHFSPADLPAPALDTTRSTFRDLPSSIAPWEVAETNKHEQTPFERRHHFTNEYESHVTTGRAHILCPGYGCGDGHDIDEGGDRDDRYEEGGVSNNGVGGGGGGGGAGYGGSSGSRGTSCTEVPRTTTRLVYCIAFYFSTQMMGKPLLIVY